MTVTQKQAEIVENFNFFDDWSDKYSYLIGLGKSLNKFPEEKKQDKYLVKGCQSLVWFDAEYKNGIVTYQGISDAAIVSGLIGLLLEIYNNNSPEDIVNSKTDFLKEIGLDAHLSPTRNNGLNSMLKFIYQFASRYVGK